MTGNGIFQVLRFIVGDFRSNKGCSVPAEVKKGNPLLIYFIALAIESCFKYSWHGHSRRTAHPPVTSNELHAQPSEFFILGFTRNPEF